MSVVFRRSLFKLPGVLHVGAASIHVSVPTIDAFVRFEIWNVATKAFEPVANLPVDLMDNDPGLNDLIDTQTTDASGAVHFAVSEVDFKSKSGEDKPDLFFRARPKGMNVGGVALPDEWSTKGWNDKNGKPGFFPNTPFTGGSSLGGSTAADPLIYRIGLDFHCRFEFVGPGDSTHHRAPKGMFFNISPILMDTIQTDINGEVHGIVFAVDGGTGISPTIGWDIEDKSINLPHSLVQNTTGGNNTRAWSTTEDDADKKTVRSTGEVFFPNNAVTSLGTQTNPEVFTCTSVNNRNACFFFLTMLYEHTSFFFNITDGAWHGVDHLCFFPTSVSGIAYSWPPGELNIPPSDFSSRGTIIHELTHQVMWKELNIGKWNIVGLVVDPKGLCLKHQEDMFENPTHAVIEGWAELLEGIFEPSGLTFVCATSTGLQKGGQSAGILGPGIGAANNRGESVEGAFAVGVQGVFQNFVVGTGSATVPRTVNGDVTTTASWVTAAGVKARFKSAIWDPLHALDPSSPKTTDFLAKIKALNSGDWHRISQSLNQCNMAMQAPTITSISPASGPAAGQTVTITGANFVTGSTEVDIGNHLTPTVVNSTTITCNAFSSSPSKQDVVVKTPAGTATLPGGYEYK